MTKRTTPENQPSLPFDEDATSKQYGTKLEGLHQGWKERLGSAATKADSQADDQFDAYVDQGMSYADVAALRSGIPQGRAQYNEVRRMMALKRADSLPDGEEKDKIIADTNRRYPAE